MGAPIAHSPAFAAEGIISMNVKVRSAIVAMVVALTACAGVRQQDLNAWVGVPVEALDTHTFFITVPMMRTMTDSGMEVRNYANGMNIDQCSGTARARSSGGWVTARGFQTCTSGWVGCNNIFYIRDRKVVEYAPTGRCMTNNTVLPQNRHLR